MILLTLLIGCDRQREKPLASTEAAKTLSDGQKNRGNTTTGLIPAISAPPLLTKAVPASIIEMPSDALPVWRLYREYRPTLVILSSDPMLMTVAPQVREEVTALVKHGKPEEFLKWGRTQTVNPLLLPEQTLTAALQSNFFGGIVWVLPPPTKDQEISPDDFRKKLMDHGILTKNEAANLSFANGIYTGTLQGLPFQATATGPLPQISGPVIVHLDFNFFTFQYRNEVTTPLFSLLHGTLVALRQTGWQTLNITLAATTEEGAFPLELRFIKNLLAEIFAQPERLDQPLPEAWELRKEALHTETFFQPETILDHYLRIEKLRPKDASVKYDIYRSLIMLKEREDAMVYLDEAIKLDKGYAREYINLATRAIDKQYFADALVYLKKARGLLPDNPFVTMETTNIMLRLGMNKEAGIKVAPLVKGLLPEHTRCVG